MTSRVRYNSYYHIWNTICKNDKPILFGKNNRRADSSDKFPGALSVFESTDYDTVFNSIKQLCENLNTKYLIFSYSNKSKVTISDLSDYFSTKFTLLKTEIIPHKENVQKKLTSNQEYMGDVGENLEYLFLIKK
jgi:adenine-specific DNA-methyltransferase